MARKKAETKKAETKKATEAKASAAASIPAVDSQPDASVSPGPTSGTAEADSTTPTVPADTAGSGPAAGSDAADAPAGSAPQTSGLNAANMGIAGADQVKHALQEAQERVYIGSVPDPTPNRNYTLGGQINGAQTPENLPADPVTGKREG